MSNQHKIMSIKDFYNGKSIFITGATGFIGKVLLEKLLRSCPGIDKIYILVRPKRGKDISDRLDDLYKNPVFEKLMQERPMDFKAKVYPIAGDISQKDLGISENDRKLLVENVTIIFHNAASIRFHDPLKINVFMNTRCTREVVLLAEKIKNLKVLLHVSTAYTNTETSTIMEEVLPPKADWRKTIQIAESIDEYTLKLLTPKYLDTFPNTYVFTKNLAEHVLMEKRGQMPIVIIRPSVVIASLTDPMPGWVDNFNGPVGLSIGGGKGVLRTVYLDPNNLLSNVPVDVAVRAIIVAAWERGVRKMTVDDDIPVLHCCDAGLKCTIGGYIEAGINVVNQVPFHNTLWFPECKPTINKLEHYWRVIFLHLLPAILIDNILKLSGKKPMLLKLHRKIYTTNLLMIFFMENQWKFINKRFLSMCDLILPHEKREFHYLFDDIDIRHYIRNSQYVCRKYLLQEPLETLNHDRKHLQRLWFASKLIQIFFWGFILWYVVRSHSYQTIKNGISEIITECTNNI